MNSLEMFELLDNRAEQARESERFEILETVRAVFGDSIEVIEFEPYGDEN